MDHISPTHPADPTDPHEPDVHDPIPEPLPMDDPPVSPADPIRTPPTD